MQYIWNEEYRPKKIEDFLCPLETEEMIKKWIAEKQIPHILFSGTPGIGKTTLAKIIINEIECDSLFINASDNNSIDTVRTDIIDFATTAGFHDLKIVVLDEFDGFSAEGQKALRNVMEEYSVGTRFILTCNHPEKVIEPIKSRVVSITLAPVSPVIMAKVCASIMTEKGVTFSPYDIMRIFKVYYPDFRKILNELQHYSVSGVLTLPPDIESTGLYDSIIDSIKKSTNKDATALEIRATLANANVRNYNELYRKLFNDVEKFSKPGKLTGNIVAIGKGSAQDTSVPDKEINAISTICDILQNNY